MRRGEQKHENFPNLLRYAKNGAKFMLWTMQTSLTSAKKLGSNSARRWKPLACRKPSLDFARTSRIERFRGGLRRGLQIRSLTGSE